MKTHIFSSRVPITKWPEQVDSICGATVKRPQPVLAFDTENCILESQNTIYICQDCISSALTIRTPRRKWLYCILPAEEAHRANLRNRAED